MTADATFTNAAPALTTSLSATDAVEVLASSGASLRLKKSVDKSAAAPGATLVYTLVFTNVGANPLTHLIINDATPPYTTFGATLAPSVPAALGTMNVTTPGAGSRGSLKWTFTGQLTPSASGSVQYTVVIEP